MTNLILSILYFTGMCVCIVLVKVFWQSLKVNKKAVQISKDESGIFIEHGMLADGSGRVFDDKRVSKQAMRSLD